MKAAILVESKQPLIVDDIDLPEHLNYGQILVKIHYSGICGAQINEIDAVKGPDKFLPHLLGHEASGEVLEIGPGVTRFRAGDKVVLHWRPSSGIQSPTPKYRWGTKTVNSGWVTTFNEQAVVSENRLTAIPDDFDMRMAPLFGCAITTAFGALSYREITPLLSGKRVSGKQARGCVSARGFDLQAHRDATQTPGSD